MVVMDGILRSLLCLIIVAYCYADCDTTLFMDGKYSRCQSLNDYYTVYWNVVGENLDLALNLQTNQNGVSYQGGWLGFGVSVNGGMRGADIAVARMVSGKYILEDRFVPGKEGEPKVDDHQDLQLISATSDAMSITVLYSRKLKSCDADEDVPILSTGTQVIFAWGKTFGYHGANRGSATVYFHYVPPVIRLPDDAAVLEYVMPEYTIPAQETTYVCTPMEFPADKKYQIVRWRPYITPGNEKYVHHMVVFVCPGPQPINNTYECGMAPQTCNTFLLAWSVGQPGYDWLGEYALPFGGEGYSRYFYLQMHYNNPGLDAGVKDASGFVFTYTAELRQYDIGSVIMTTDLSSISILPQTDTYTQWAECPSACTAKFNYSLNVIGYFPHMHTIGQKIWLQHVRGDQELPEIHRDDHYDFQRQQSYAVDVTIQPHDRLILHCVWNSMERTTKTIGGESSQQEMCVGVIQYYPAPPAGTFNLATCSDFGGSPRYKGQALCAGMVNVTYPEYTPLAPPVTTCPADESSSSMLAPFYAIMVVLFSLLLLA